MKKRKWSRKEEAKMSREVYGVLCFKMGETGTCLSVCDSLIALPIV